MTETETILLEAVIIKKITECNSRKELDNIRCDIVEIIEALNRVDSSLRIQQAFRKQLNKLKRSGWCLN